MTWIIIVAVIVAVLALYAFWPRRRGVVDQDVRLAKRRDAGRGDYYGGLGSGG